jgi:hypothetical protein
MTRAGTTAGEHQQSSADGGGQAIFEEHEGRLLLVLSHARVTRVWCAPQCGLDESRDEADDDALVITLVIMDIYGECLNELSFI